MEGKTMKTKSINGFVGMTWLGVLLVLGLPAIHAVAATGAAVPLVVRLQPNTNGTTTVRFQGAAGASYRIESSDTLDSWTSLAGSVTAQGEWTEWNDIRPAAQAQRFYRVTSASGVAQTAMRAVDPGTDSERLLTALAGGDTATVISILRNNGVGEASLNRLAANLVQPPPRTPLAHEFYRGCLPVNLPGQRTNAGATWKVAVSLGYDRRCWVVQDLRSGWGATNTEVVGKYARTNFLGAMNMTLGDTNLVQYFKWFDRNADVVGSVAINWGRLGNHPLPGSSEEVARTLGGLFKLVKARKPDAFVWVSVLRVNDNSDVEFLSALPFKPDGLLIWNLDQFNSPFETVRQSYAGVLGDDVPMVVSGFVGYKAVMREKASAIRATNKIKDPAARAAAWTKAESKMAQVGAVSKEAVLDEERHLRELGYRGMILHGFLVEALTRAEQAK